MAKTYGSDIPTGPRGDKKATPDVPVTAPRSSRNPVRVEEGATPLPANFGVKKVKNMPKPVREVPEKELSAEQQQTVKDLGAERFAQRDAAQKATDERLTLRTSPTTKGPSSLHNELTAHVDLVNQLGRPTGDRVPRWRTLSTMSTNAVGDHVLQSYKTLDDAKADITAKREVEATRRAANTKTLADINAPKVRKKTQIRKVEENPKKKTFVPKKVK